jgi:hypothetical protein
MPNHGAEANLPISELAQWMRDTTGQPDDGKYGGIIVYEIEGRTYHHESPAQKVVIKPGAPRIDAPGTLTVDDVVEIAAIDPIRLHRAAQEAIASYSGDDPAEHQRRIWALHDQILGETIG